MASFNPNWLIFIGAIIAAIGALWSSHQQTQFERDIRLKTESAINAVIGGDSYCYVMPQVFSGNEFSPTVVCSGEWPMYDVSIRIVDVTVMPYVEYHVNAGNFARSSASLHSGLKIPIKHSHNRFNVFVSARNGFITSNIQLVNIDSSWLRAVRAYRDHDATKILYEFSDPNFPATNGTVDWSESTPKN